MNLDRIIALNNNRIIYRNGDQCIKVFSTDFARTDVLNEALNHSRMADEGLSVPQLMEVTTVNGKWAIVMEYIRGKSLEQMLAEGTITPEKALQLLTDLQLKVHRIRCPLMRSLSDDVRHKLRKAKLSPALQAKMFVALETLQMDDHVCHGDMTPVNIMIARDGTPYILGWAHANRGDTILDAAFTRIRFLMKGEKELADKYTALFCEKQHLPHSAVLEKTPLAAAALYHDCSKSDRQFLLDFMKQAGC